MSLLHGLNQPAGIAQELPPFRERLIFSGLKICPLQFRNLIMQGVYTPGLLRFIHPQSRHLAPDLPQGSIGGLVVR